MSAETYENGDTTEIEALEGTLIPAPLPRSPTTTPRRYRLNSPRLIRRELASLYAEMRNGTLDTDQTRTGAFVLRCVLESIRMDEFEQRLTTLEKKAP